MTMCGLYTRGVILLTSTKRTAKERGKTAHINTTSGSPCSLLKEYLCSQDADATQRRRTKWQRATASASAALISHTPAHPPGRRTGSVKKSLWRQDSGTAGTGSVLFCLDKAHAHTNAACVLASFSFVVCPSFAKENGQYFQIHL